MTTNIYLGDQQDTGLNNAPFKLVPFSEIITSGQQPKSGSLEQFQQTCAILNWAKDTIAPPSGLLRPLKVQKVSEGYRLLSSEIDCIAIKKVHGKAASDLQVPVTFDDSETNIAEISTIFKEAQKLYTQFSNGVSVDQLAKSEDKSELAIYQHIALGKLPKDIQLAASNGYLQLRAAAALTMIPPEYLQIWRDAFAKGENWSKTEDGIKAKYSNHLIEKEDALFSLKKYDGGFIEDWFDIELTHHFRDRLQFWKLQFEAIRKIEYQLHKAGWKRVLVHSEGQPNTEMNYSTILGQDPFKCPEELMGSATAMIHIYNCGYVDFSVVQLGC